jgi:hypothetical protein
VPIIIGKLDDLSAPERIFVRMNLLPKVATPLEIILVDVEVAGVRKAAQQRRRQRSEMRGDLEGRFKFYRANRVAVVLSPLAKQRIGFVVHLSVGHLCASLVAGLKRTPDLLRASPGLQGPWHRALVVKIPRPFSAGHEGLFGHLDHTSRSGSEW